MTTREEIHELLDQLPESELEDLHRVVLERLAKHDPVLQAFLNAPEDDEPETEEERTAVAEAYEDFRAGRVFTLEQVKRELDL